MRERLGDNVLREKLGEHCDKIDCGNTVLRERLRENYAERERLGNTVLREVDVGTL
jgi:hypothetical protein